MKRLTGLSLIVTLLLSLTACGGDAASPEATTVASAEPTIIQTTPATEPENGADTLVDNESCAFSIRAVALSDYAGMELEVECVNKTDRSLIFSWVDVSVCGYQYDPLWSQEVAPGERLAGTIGIDTYRLESWGVMSVDEITFTLNVFDSEDFMAEPYVDDVFQIFPTGLTGDTVTYPDRVSTPGEQVVADNSGLSFIIESFQDDADVYTLRCYVRNGTDEALMLSLEDVTVNGVAIDPMWSELVSAGKQAYSQVTFLRSQLEDNGIGQVERIDFRLNAVSDDQGTVLLDQSATFTPADSTVG